MPIRPQPTVTVLPAEILARTVVVALPAGTPTADLLAAANRRVAAAGLASLGGVPYFLARPGRSRHLLDRWHGLTTGAAVARLDLAGMRQRSAFAATMQWRWWRYVTASTPTARSWTELRDRSEQDPEKYPLHRAQRDFAGQPRIVAMQAHNALPRQQWPLPPSELELFQAGELTYSTVAWLSAVPADGLACPDGPLLQPHSRRLADRITYLRLANAHLDRLGPDAALVAVVVTGPYLPLDD
ncbi:hypothetical protein [Dactylosporangium sp. NPDC005555]|uniref:hypothetical protein n=1 Tax=Dactylosporangium sp. NPDC005555 TaxID=3154889 RepID=UPI0033B1E49D